MKRNLNDSVESIYTSAHRIYQINTLCNKDVLVVTLTELEK